LAINRQSIFILEKTVAVLGKVIECSRFSELSGYGQKEEAVENFIKDMKIPHD